MTTWSWESTVLTCLHLFIRCRHQNNLLSSDPNKKICDLVREWLLSYKEFIQLNTHLCLLSLVKEHRPTTSIIYPTLS